MRDIFRGHNKRGTRHEYKGYSTNLSSLHVHKDLICIFRDCNWIWCVSINVDHFVFCWFFHLQNNSDSVLSFSCFLLCDLAWQHKTLASICRTHNIFNGVCMPLPGYSSLHDVQYNILKKLVCWWWDFIGLTIMVGAIVQMLLHWYGKHRCDFCKVIFSYFSTFWRCLFVKL